MTIFEQIKAEIERLKAKYQKDMYKSNHEGLASVYKIEAYNELLSFLDTLESEKPMNLDELMKEAQRYYSDNFEYLSSDQPTLSILTNVARHFAEWGAEHAKIESEKPVPKDLEEAADEMAIRAFPEKKSYSTVYDRVVDYNAVDRKNYRDGIIAGAKWDAEHFRDITKMISGSSGIPNDLDEAELKYAGASGNPPANQEEERMVYDAFIAGYNFRNEQMLNQAVKWLVDDDYDELTDKGKFILGSVGIGYNGYYIPYSDLLKLPKED